MSVEMQKSNMLKQITLNGKVYENTNIITYYVCSYLPNISKDQIFNTKHDIFKNSPYIIFINLFVIEITVELGGNLHKSSWMIKRIYDE